MDAIFTLVELAFNINQYLPMSWSNSQNLYPLYLVSEIPSKILTILVLIFAETLRLTRSAKWLNLLRGTVLLLIAALVIELVIDKNYFESNVIFDFISLIWPCIFFLYLYLSQRIKKVFVSKDWPKPETTYSQTFNEKDPEFNHNDKSSK